MNLNNFPKFIDFESPEEAVLELEKLREFDDGWINQEARYCYFDEFKFSETHNRYTVNINDVPFECLFYPSKTKKLYVMLSGGGAAHRRYPLFLRWKYKNFLKGNVFMLDDPMYHFHDDISHVMWYYGTKESSYLMLAMQIVIKIMDQLSINAEDVVFVGSSGGGYAALFLGNMLDHSSVIAMNPQLILKYWQHPGVYNNFIKWGIDLADDDVYGRNRICLTNETVNFLICVNCKSDHDYKIQFKEFALNHGLYEKYGLSKANNIITWIHATEYDNIHAAIPEIMGMVFMDFVINESKKGTDINELNSASIILNEVLYEKYFLKSKINKLTKEHKIYRDYFISMLSQAVNDALNKFVSVHLCQTYKNCFINGERVSDNFYNWYVYDSKIAYYQLLFHNWKFYLRLVIEDISSLSKECVDLLNYVHTFASNTEDMIYYNKRNRLVVTKVLRQNECLSQVNEFIENTIETLYAINDPT